MKRRSGFGWMELIIGIALAVLGIFTFVYPDNAVTTHLLFLHYFFWMLRGFVSENLQTLCNRNCFPSH